MSIRERAWVSWPNRTRAALLGYLGLTKPRVIELLLVTAIPAMLLAHRGTVAPLLILNTLIGGMLAAAGANTLNCVADADIDKVMKRTARRPLPRAAVPTRHALVFGIVLSVASFFWLWWTTNLLSGLLAVGHDRVLRVRLHIAAEAPNLTERRLGRGRRVHAGDDRLVRGHRDHRLAGAGDVRDHLLLDTAAHLGAGDALQGGLPGSGRADAARGRDRTPSDQTDPGVHVAHRRRDPGSGPCRGLAVRVGRRAGRGVVPGDGASAVRRVYVEASL